MKQQKGFTLIELIIVIVILGILAVTAAPRFIDIQSDARKETIQGVKAALQGSAQLVYAKSAIAGVQGQATNASNVQIASNTISVAYGYPDASAVTAANIVNFVDIDVSADSPLELVPASDSQTAANEFWVKFRNVDSTAPAGGNPASGCYVTFTSAAASGATPAIAVIDNGGC